MTTHTISVTVNGVRHFLKVASNSTLLEVLRDQLVLTGMKSGCAAGECGACIALLNGEAVNTCLVLAAEADQGDIVTIEGLAAQSPSDALIEAFVQHGALQCGYCTPGMIVSARAFLKGVADAGSATQPIDEQRIRTALSGNICRCTGYVHIVKAVLATAKQEGLPCAE